MQVTIFLQVPKLDQKTSQWKLQNANLERFQKQCQDKLTPESNNNNEDYLTYFTKAFTSISGENIPKSFTSTKFSKPWLDKNCKKCYPQEIQIKPYKRKQFRQQQSQSMTNYNKSQTNLMDKLYI